VPGRRSSIFLLPDRDPGRNLRELAAPGLKIFPPTRATGVKPCAASRSPALPARTAWLDTIPLRRC